MKLSALVAVRNEANHIGDLLADLDAQADPGCDVEIVFADGESDDSTFELIEQWCSATRHDARIITNPQRRQYLGVNLLIGEACGDLIVKLDGHSRLADDFFRRLVEVQRQGRAAIVGGRMSCVGLSGPIGGAIGAAQRARFGAGGAAFRIGGEPRYVDAVPFPCVRKEVFERVGLFRRALVRNADTEFFDRARRAGEKVWFDPAIQSTYFVRPTLWAIAVQQFRNGYWFPAMLRAARIRHLVPLGFVLALIALPLLAILLSPVVYWVLLAVLGLYGTVVVGTAATAEYEELSLAGRALILIILPVMHLSYGFGWLFGFMSPRVWRAAIQSMGPAPLLSPKRDSKYSEGNYEAS